MYADEDTGLTIDAPDSGDEENPDLSTTNSKSVNSSNKINDDFGELSPKNNFTKLSSENANVNVKSSNTFSILDNGKNSNSPMGQRHHRTGADLFMSVDDGGLEEGEIPSGLCPTDEPMIRNFLEPATQTPAKKRKMTQMVDASTCVAEADDFDDMANMKNNQYYKLNVLILSRSSTSSGHTFMFTTNIKGQMYHGVLTDGSPPTIHNNQIQKRAMAAEKDKGGAEDGEAAEKVDVTPKPRGPKRSRCEDERTPVKAKHNRHKSPHLHEVAKDPYVRCPHTQCGNRFLAMPDLNSHLMLNHVNGGVVLKDEAATQTTEPFMEKCKVCEEREQKMREENSISQLFGGIKGDKAPVKKEDDDVAPKLEKVETEPHKDYFPLSPNLEAMVRDARLPTMPSISLRPEQQPMAMSIPSTVSMKMEPSLPPTLQMVPQSMQQQQQQSVAPFLWNGNPFANNGISLAAAVSGHKPQMQLGPGFPGMPQAVNGISPIPSGSKIINDPQSNRHKIHELKVEAGTSNMGSNPGPGSVPNSTPTNSGNVPCRSITAGTSGNPMESLLRLQRPAAPSPIPPPQMYMHALQQQMIRQLLANQQDVNQFAYLNAQQGAFPPPK